MTPSWVKDVLPLYEKYAADVPLWLVLGWISVESGGAFGQNTTSVFAAGERGYFQLSPGEAADLGWDPANINASPDNSFHAGADLVHANLDIAYGYGFGGDDAALCAKLIHGMGSGSVKVCIDSWTSNESADFSFASFENYCRANDTMLSQAIQREYGSLHLPSKWFDNARRVEYVGRALEAGSPEAVAASQSGSIDTGVAVGLVLAAAVVAYAVLS